MVWPNGVLVKYTRTHKKVENICFKFDKYKKIETKKPHVHILFLIALKIQKDSWNIMNFAWKFCGYNFESMKIYSNN
jgi:hypothetical protein